MNTDSNFLIWVTKRHYWDLNLLPTKNEDNEYVNICTLVDSETGKSIESIAFNSEFLVPVFQTRSKNGIKEIGKTLWEISKKHNLEMVSSEQMPPDKRRKETKKVCKRRF